MYNSACPTSRATQRASNRSYLPWFKSKLCLGIVNTLSVVVKQTLILAFYLFIVF